MAWLKNFAPVQRLVYGLVGLASYPALVGFNRLRISGTENLRHLPTGNVLFVSNHQTYFFDVIALLHIFCAVKSGRRDRLGMPLYLLNPLTRIRYVAADQTMRKSWMSRLFGLAGAVTVKRTWSPGTKEVRTGLDPSDTRKITRELAANWMITFPQGTTTPFAPGRKGTALIIKQSKPIVIPVVLSGFAEAFEKCGLGLRQRGTELSVRFKPPLPIDYAARPDETLARIMVAIEQYPAPAAHKKDRTLRPGLFSGSPPYGDERVC